MENLVWGLGFGVVVILIICATIAAFSGEE